MIESRRKKLSRRLNPEERGLNPEERGSLED
jgi:hypothetical protein